MILGKALILKGLAGVAAVGGAVTIGVVGQKMGLFGKSIDPVLKELIEGAGLSCNLDNICTLKTTGKINIKQDQDKSEIDAVASSDSSSGKIKVYTGTDTTDYEKGFKFVIEEGDITVGSGSSKKLEQFETYEIKKDETDSKWYLTRKKKAEDEIKRLLGITEENCTLGATISCSSVSLDAEKLKKINFEGKKEEGATIATGGTANLTITKTTTDTTTFPLGYKFVFDPTGEVTISSSNKIAKSSKTEFKIKVTPSSGDTPVSLALEKAWTVTTLGEKVGLVCPDPSNNGEKKCTFTDNKINVHNDSSNKIEEAKVKADSTGKKMTYLEDQENYSQGFKLTVDGSESITLAKGEDNSTTLNIENNTNTYEIKEQTVSGSTKWYLSKCTPTAS